MFSLILKPRKDENFETQVQRLRQLRSLARCGCKATVEPAEGEAREAEEVIVEAAPEPELNQRYEKVHATTLQCDSRVKPPERKRVHRVGPCDF